MTDFSDHPVSLAEAKANKAHDCRLWAPRDALISALRDVDSGERDFNAIVIVARATNEAGEMQTSFYNATPDIHTALGLLARGQFRLMES